MGKVLVIEDTPGIRRSVRKILEKNGYEVFEAEDGEAGLKSSRSILPDLILLDIMLPGMDGYGVCKLLKRNRETKHIPVIFMTAKTEIEDIERGFDAGGVDYVTKPFNPRELIARVKTHIEMKILRGIIPICDNCKSISINEDFWQQLEDYIKKHSNVTFSQIICNDCAKEMYSIDEELDV
ncbi:response regulator [bacterium]|nr:response regulator [bacterium]